MLAVPQRQPAPDDQPWYVCMTKPRQERVAEAHLVDQGYEVYVPELITWKQLRAGWQQKRDVMFPRYAFVRPGRLGQTISPVRSTPGVSTLVRFGHVLGRMAPCKLNALRALVRECGERHPERPFEPGACVVVSSGPLKGLQGLVSAVAAERVTVMLGLLGREQRVALGIDQLECV